MTWIPIYERATTDETINLEYTASRVQYLHFIGHTSRNINFDDAAAFWVSFYHLMFKANRNSMKRKDLRLRITHLSELFGEPINYYAVDTDSKNGFVRV